MTMPITDDQLLTATLVIEMTDIIDKIAENLLKKLTDDNGLIQQIVYGAGDPNWYPRQMKNRGLLGAFDKTDATATGNDATVEVGEHPETMRFDPEHFIHGSYYWTSGLTDIRKLLTDIITEGLSGPLFGEGYWTSPRDFWKPLLDMLEDGTIESMIEAEFTKRKINFIKI